MRLQKFLAECGIDSRRRCEEFIIAERVLVNGSLPKLGDTIDPDADRITLDGRPLEREKKVYVLLNKPTGVVTTLKDTHGRKTVLDSISGIEQRIVPVGRLDMDVTGALLLTNDGDLAHRLAHPSYEVDKMYEAEVEGDLTRDAAAELQKGVVLDDGTTAPARVDILEAGSSSTRIRLVIHEGKNRLVKRMCAAVGHPVRKLHRVSIGSISVENLKPGEWCHLSPGQIAELKDAPRFGKNSPEAQPGNPDA